MSRAQDDAVYIVDELTIGLHPLDVRTSLPIFKILTDSIATVIVIEHDLAFVRSADYIIDIGPAARRQKDVS